MDKTQYRKEQLIKLAQSGGTDKELVILDEINALEDKVDQKTTALENEILNVKEIISKENKLLDGIDMLKGEDGEDGHTPTDEELTALIKPLILEVKDGNIPTKEELLAIIKPLIPKEQVITDSKLLSLITPLIPQLPRIETLANEASKLAVEEVKLLIPTIEDKDTGDEIIDKINDSSDDKLIDNKKVAGFAELERLAKKPTTSNYSGVLGIKGLTAGTSIVIDNTNAQYPKISSTASGVSIGSTVTGGTSTSVLFIDENGKLAQDTANFNYVQISSALSVGTLNVTNTIDNSQSGVGNFYTNYLDVLDASANSFSVEMLVVSGLDQIWPTITAFGNSGAPGLFFRNDLYIQDVNFTGTANITFFAGDASLSGGLGFDTTAGVFTLSANSVSIVNNLTAKTLKINSFTVAGLPTGSQGMLAFVTNALAPVAGTAVVGGGAKKIPVYHNGTAWIAGSA